MLSLICAGLRCILAWVKFRSLVFDGLELAAVDRNARVAAQSKAAAQHQKLAANLADGLTIVLAEAGYCLEVRHQPAGQPNQLDVALTLPLQTPARLKCLMSTSAQRADIIS
jgi:hypothetical protein